MPLFTEQQLQKHIGSNTIFRRGKGYANRGHIEDIGTSQEGDLTKVVAIIFGTDEYYTEIAFDSRSGKIAHSECDCPYWDTCKHIAGLGLLAIKEYKRGELFFPGERSSTRAPHDEDIFSSFETREGSPIIDVEEVKPREKPEFELQVDNGWLVLLLKKGQPPFDFSYQASEHRLFWEMLFAPFPPGETKFLLPPRLLSRALPILAESQGIIVFGKNTRYSFIKLEREAKPLHLSLSAQRDELLLTLNNGKILLGDGEAWLFEENRFSPLLPGAPTALLNVLAQGPWKVPQMEAEKMLGTVLPFLQERGHIVECQDDIRAPVIHTKPEIHFFLSQKEVKGKRYLQIRGEFRVPKNQEDTLSLDAASSPYYAMSFLEVIHDTLSNRFYYLPPYTSYQKAKSKKIERKGSRLLVHLGDQNYLQWNEELVRDIISEIFPGDVHGLSEERTKDAVLVEFASHRFFEFVRRFQKLPQRKPEWHVHKAAGLENLSLKKKKASIDFDFDLQEEAGLFSFDWEAKLGAQHISLEKLQEMFRNFERYYEGEDGAFIEMSNKKDLEELLRMAEKFEKKENGRHEGKMYHIPEVLHFVDQKARIAKQDEAFSSFFTEVKKGKPVERVPIPKETKGLLRSYQKKGVHWGHFLRKYRFGGILADDMGLGKTVQALTLLASVQSKLPSLIVCPKTLIYNWDQEITKFFPKKNVLVVTGSVSKRKQVLSSAKVQKADIIITSYPLLQKDVELYRALKKPFEYMVLDEAQHIKNHKTKTAQVVKTIDAKYRLALTGTALENGVADIWSIFDFLMPGFLGKYEEFRQEYENPIQKWNSSAPLKKLTAKVKPFMLRRTKEKVLKDLPPKIEQNVFCELSNDQLVLYTQTLAQVKKEIFDVVEKKGFDRSRIEILAALTRLRQICNHPRTVVPTKKHTSSGKFDLFFELLEEVQEGERKVLVFSSFVKTLQLLKEELDHKKIAYSYLDGSTNNRPKVISEFENDPKKSCFLISMKAGGTGLNLTAADTVFLFDPWWNPMVEMQAMDRAHRIGQKKTVNVYSLLTKGTLEEKMLTIKDRKKKLFESVVGENEEFLQKLTWGDIEGLFEL